MNPEKVTGSYVVVGVQYDTVLEQRSRSIMNTGRPADAGTYARTVRFSSSRIYHFTRFLFDISAHRFIPADTTCDEIERFDGEEIMIGGYRAETWERCDAYYF